MERMKIKKPKALEVAAMELKPPVPSSLIERKLQVVKLKEITSLKEEGSPEMIARYSENKLAKIRLETAVRTVESIKKVALIVK